MRCSGYISNKPSFAVANSGLLTIELLNTMIGGKRVSVVVPAYNEEATIAQVLKPLANSKTIDEVICINDGSTDGTGEKIKKFRTKVKVKNNPGNKGKGYALAVGIKESRGDVVAFCDSDLIGLKAKHIEDIVKKLIDDQNTKCVMGIPESDESFHNFTGERAYYRADLLPLVDQFEPTGYGVETCLNHYFGPEVTQTVVLDNVIHLLKKQKLSPVMAYQAYIKEGLEIAKEQAILNGIWDRQLEAQLLKITKARSLTELKMVVRKVKDKTIRDLFNKYFSGYVEKIRSYLLD